MNGGTLQKQVNKLTNYGDSERSNHSNHTNASNPKLIPTKKIVKRIETDNTLLRSKTAIHEKHIEFRESERDADGSIDDLSYDQDFTLYRIKTKRKKKNENCWDWVKHFFGCLDSTILSAFDYENVISEKRRCGNTFSINHSIIYYLNWTFRTSFAVLFASLLVGFFSWIIFFTILMILMGYESPECFQPNFNESATPFADAFALSWTTFTTVGYGHTYPSKGVELEDHQTCFGLVFLCTFEAFVGVVFSGVCTAIMFGKVIRIQSEAPVVFSDPITIRFGRGVCEYDDSTDDTEPKVPFPVLTFRLVNLYSNEINREIVDAQVNVIAITEGREYETQYGNLTHVEIKKRPRRGRKRKGSRSIKSPLGPRKKFVIAEDPGSLREFQHHFVKLDLDNFDNPYFKRIWSVSHRLDHLSPIVLPHVQRRIIENNNCWPEELNTYMHIRKSIDFTKIFVSFSGVSICSSDSVFAQHMYDFSDVNIGYQFVPLLSRGEDYHMKVDIAAINDVIEQNGGGAEPFMDDIDVDQTIRPVKHRKKALSSSMRNPLFRQTSPRPPTKTLVDSFYRPRADDGCSPLNGSDDGRSPVNGSDGGRSTVNGSDGGRSPVNGSDGGRSPVNGSDGSRPPVKTFVDNSPEL